MAKISALPLAGPLDGSEHIPLVQSGEARRINAADHMAYLALGAELARDQAADLVLAQNIFVDVDLPTAEASVAIGTTFKIVNSDTGIVEVRQRTDPGSTLLYHEATAAALAAPFASQNLGHNDGGVGAVAATVQWHLRLLPIDPRSYGAVLDGETDDGPALRTCFAVAALSGRPIHIPAGMTLLFTDQSTFNTGIEFVPPPGLEIFGDGPTSVLKFRRVAYSSSYGLSLKNDGFTLRNLAVVVDINGGAGFAAAVAVTGGMKNLLAENVDFQGQSVPVFGIPSGQYAVLNWFADCENIRFVRSTFRNLDFGWVKTSSDPSTQRGFRAIDCQASFCQEVFELNSPGLFNALATIGETQLTAIDTGTTHLVAGQKIKSPALPNGTTIVSIDGPNEITVSAPATATGEKRFSVGTVTDIKILRLQARHILQWAVGLANCRDAEIDGHFEDIAYEAVHLEDHSENVNVTLSGSGCNKQPGVPGSPGANNGAVQILSGCRGVSVRFLDFDLRETFGGSPNGMVVQPIVGSIAGTTNETAASTGITVCGRLLGKAGCKHVIAYDTDIVYGDLRMESPDAASKVDPVITMEGCSWQGRIFVLNPATIAHVNNASLGQFSEISLTTTENGFPDLIWSTGFFGAARNAPPLTSKVSFILPTVADPDATPTPLCPAPWTLFGTVLRKYVGGEHAYEAGAFNIKAGELVPTEVSVEQNSINLTPDAGVPAQTDDGWDIVGGILRFRAYADPAITCQARITLTGDLLPAA